MAENQKPEQTEQPAAKREVHPKIHVELDMGEVTDKALHAVKMNLMALAAGKINPILEQAIADVTDHVATALRKFDDELAAHLESKKAEIDAQVDGELVTLFVQAAHAVVDGFKPRRRAPAKKEEEQK